MVNAFTFTLAALLATAAAAAPSKAPKVVKANVTEDFEVPNDQNPNCGILPSCGDNVPGLSHSLLWSNITSEIGFTTGSGNPAGQQPYTGYFLGQLGAAPSVTANYAKSRVTSFDLKKFAFGCSAQYNVTDPPGAPPGTYTLTGSVNCTMRVTGFRGGKQVATVDLPFQEFPYQTNLQGVPYYGMRDYILPARFTALRTVKFHPLPVKKAKYVNLQAAIDTVQYVTTNVTST